MRAIPPIASSLCACLLSLTALAQSAPEAPAADAAQAAPQLTRADLEAWLDGFMGFALPRGNIAGAVVVVVKDGETLLQKGYGYADLEKQAPVDPEGTLFRPGSISKLFTWTAVMQLAEQGKLDLDADVNGYLDFEIPPGPNGTPIRLRDLMMHTPGFEESVKELIIEDASRVVPLGEVLKRWVPHRIYEAGKMPAYSNYGTALAGYIVERVSGQGFDDYLEQHIFTPLGMAHSSFRQPLPEALLAGMSQGYDDASGKPQGYEIINLTPAGALAATGADMARFMIAHLQKGELGGQRILAAETAEKMHGTANTVIPELNRMVLGFYETNTNGRRIISHGGDTQYFHSDLHLYLDDGVGYYISFNSTGKQGAAGPLRAAFYRQFSDRYLPGPGPGGEVDEALAKEHAAQLAGSYVISRRAESSFLSLANLASPVRIVVNEDGTVSMPLLRGLNGEPKKFREIRPYLWAEVGGKAVLAAEVVDGRVTRFSADFFAPFMFFERAPAKAAGWVMPAVVASVAALFLTVLFWPVAALVRRHYRQRLPYSGAEARAYRWVRIGALAALLAFAAWAGTIAMMFRDFTNLSPKFDGWIVVLHVLGSIAVFAGLALALWHLSVLAKAKRRWLGKTWAVVLVAATGVLAWIAFAYNLVGLSTDY
ncbi:MAG: beta-lactamase family protein [Steroidobacteraceae bacterium]|nr:beta-lactamase family protein [Steroidobacteraceae bacterium]